MALYLFEMPKICRIGGLMATDWNDGRILTDADAYEHIAFARDVVVPLLKQARDQSVGARYEFYDMVSRNQYISSSLMTRFDALGTQLLAQKRSNVCCWYICDLPSNEGECTGDARTNDR